MAKNDELDAKDIEARVHDLSISMERMKTHQAERDDVVVELKQSQLTRLELLARDLQSVFDQVPDDNEQFEFALTHGETPRLWLDMTSHVRMGAKPHLYELVKDTRMGRTILSATTDRIRMGQIVTDYIANKMLERERLIEGEWVSMGGYDFDGNPNSVDKKFVTVIKHSGWNLFGWFGLGAIVSLVVILVWGWY